VSALGELSVTVALGQVVQDSLEQVLVAVRWQIREHYYDALGQLPEIAELGG